MHKIDNKPTLSHIFALLMAKSEDITNGECEFIASKEALNLWWPVDEFVFLSLVKDGLLDSFYTESQELLCEFLRELDLSSAIDVVKEALIINQKLIKRPFAQDDETIACRFNTLDFYSNLIVGSYIELEESFPIYVIERKDATWGDWDKWCADVVWYGTKKGAYLHGWSRISSQESVDK